MKHIDNIIHECINKFLITEFRAIPVNESLNNVDYPLYHNTTMYCLIKMMETNSIKSNTNDGFPTPNDTEYTHDVHNCICFTRKSTYNPFTENNVLIKIDPRKLMLMTKNMGLKLIPFQDTSGFEGLDEYEERLISKNSRDFSINNLSNIVDEVIISICDLCEYIIECGEDEQPYIDELKQVANNNIFGNKLKIVDYLDTQNTMTPSQAIAYITDTCRCE